MEISSRNVVEGTARSPHRAMYRAMGLEDEDISKSFVGVCHTGNVIQVWQSMQKKALVRETPRIFSTRWYSMQHTSARVWSHHHSAGCTLPGRSKNIFNNCLRYRCHCICSKHSTTRASAWTCSFFNIFKIINAYLS